MRGWKALLLVIAIVFLIMPASTVLASPSNPASSTINLPSDSEVHWVLIVDGFKPVPGIRLLKQSHGVYFAEATGSAIDALSSEGAIVLNIDYMKNIEFLTASFDPLKGLPHFEGWLAPQKGATHYRIVQFRGPVTQDEVIALQGAGARIIEYVPYNAYIVYADDSAFERIKGIPGVRWVGDYSYAFRIHPDVLSAYKDQVFAQVVAGFSRKSTGPLGAYPSDEDLRSVSVIYDAKALNPRVLAGMFKKAIIDMPLYGDLRVVRGLMSMKDVLSVAKTEGVLWIEPYRVPKLFDELYMELDEGPYPEHEIGQPPNELGTWTDVIAGYTGQGVTIALGDTGIYWQHPDFQDRVVAIHSWAGDDGHDGYGHGTATSHVAAGYPGVPPEYATDENGYYWGLGQSPSSLIAMDKIFSDAGSWLFPDYYEMAKWAHDVGALVHSNSWGAATGGAYTSDDAIFDWLVRDSDYTTPDVAEPMTFVFAAGNEGPGAMTIGSPGNGKNVITVGGTEIDRFGYSHENIIWFASRGPTADGRIKPDIVLPAGYVAVAHVPGTSTGWGLINPYYKYWGGTSFACPGGAGLSATFISFYREMFGTDPLPSLIKSALIASAYDLHGTDAEKPIPNFNEGWGFPYLPNIIFPEGHGVQFLDVSNGMTTALQTGEVWEYDLPVLSSDTPLKVIMAYIDYPGNPGAAVSLVNDLMLEVESPSGTVYVGNNFGSDGFSVPGGSDDTRNNVEGVIVNNPEVGTWHIRVYAVDVSQDSVIETPQVDQDFSITVVGPVPSQAKKAQVKINKALYHADDWVTVTVIDDEANINPNWVDYVTVKVTAQGTGDVLTMHLQEIGPDKGIFKGTFRLLPGDAVDDGTLQVRLADEFNVTYVNKSGSVFWAVGEVDSVPPTIESVEVTGTTSMTATIHVVTDEPTKVRIAYGYFPSKLQFVKSDNTLSTDHVIVIDGLDPAFRFFYTISVTDRNDNPTEWGMTDQFVTKPPNPVLVVDDTANDPNFSYVLDALDAAGVKYDLYKVSSGSGPSIGTLAKYKLVIWSTGYTWSSTLTDEDQENLAAYLDSGGNLVLFGQDIIWDIGTNWFVTQYLHASSVLEDEFYYSIEGVAGNPFTYDFSYIYLDYYGLGYYAYDDYIYPDSLAVPILADYWYGNPVAIYADTGTYKVIFGGFMVEVWGYSDPDTLTAFFSRVNSELVSAGGNNLAIGGMVTDRDWYAVGSTASVATSVYSSSGSFDDVYLRMVLAEPSCTPKVSIVYPAPGQLVYGTVPVIVDAEGAIEVDAYAGGMFLGSDHDYPFMFSWDTSGLPGGTYTIYVRATDAQGHVAEDSIQVKIFGTLGPDGFGYTASLTSFNWIDAESSGELLYTGVDDGGTYYTLPFSFPFYDMTLNSVYVGSNGGIGPNYISFSNSALPTSSYNWIIAPWWDDLVVGYGSDYGVYVLETTFDGQNAVVIQYNARHFGGSGMYQFEVILLEGGDIIFQYLETTGGGPSYDNGASATVGIQGSSDASLNYYLQVSYNEPIIFNGMAIRFYRPVKAAASDEVPSPRTVGGPDGFGYYYDDTVAFNWIDFTTGTRIADDADDETFSVTLPFSFPFYGMMLNSVTVSSNGFIAPSGDTNSDYSNEELPTDEHDFIIAPFWDDLAFDSYYYSPAGIYTLQTTFDGQNAFVIGWIASNWLYDDEPDAYYEFEAILLEDGTIYFQYNDVSGDGYHDYGASATVGIQGSSDTSLGWYLQYSYDESSLSAGLAIKFYRVTTNQPPAAPTISAPSEVYPFTEFTITVSSTDPNGDDIMYEVDWGDGSTTMTDFYPSGASVQLTHEYTEKGTFTVTVTAYDRFAAASDPATTTIHVIWYDISEARSLPDGTSVFVVGQVTVRPLVFSDKIFWIQDGTAGIKVYTDGFSVASLPLSEFTKVAIIGTMDTYRGDREIVVTDMENIIILGSSSKMVAPKDVVVSWARNINGELVTFYGNIVRKGSSYIDVADDTGSIRVYIDRDTGIDLTPYEVGDLVKVTGVQTYYRSTPEILPRWQGDVEKVEGSLMLQPIGSVGDKEVVPLMLQFTAEEGDFIYNIGVLAGGDSSPLDNYAFKPVRHFTPEEPIKVAILDSWASDNFGYTSFPTLMSKWYLFGNAPIIVDSTTLNTDPLTWEGFLDANPDVFFISDAWTYNYGWEFSQGEANMIKAWLTAGHSGIATSGTFSVTPGYTEGMNLMFLADAWGLNSSIPAYWADYAFHYYVTPGHEGHFLFTNGPFCTALGSEWDNGVYLAAVGNVPEGATVLAVNYGIYTGLAGILTEYYYMGGTTMFVPTLPELGVSSYGHNRADDTLLYNMIYYAAKNRAPYSGADLSVISMDVSGMVFDVGQTVQVNASVVNAGLSTLVDVPILLLSVDLETGEATILDYQIVPALGYLDKADLTFEFTTSEEGPMALAVLAYYEDDPTPDTNYVLSLIYVVHPEGTIRVVGVDSFSTDNPDYTVLPILQQYWFLFGKYKIDLDTSSLNKDDITYEDLVNAHPDVLFISDAWYEGYGWEFTDSEIDAITTFVGEGHAGIIATGGSAAWNNGYHGNYNNYKFGPLFGLDMSNSVWATYSTIDYYSADGMENHELLISPGEVGYYDEGIGRRVWSTGGYFTTYDWELAGASLIGGDYYTIFEDSHDGAITIYEYNHGCAIYFQHIPELAPAVSGATLDDYQLVYNAIVYAYKYTDDVAPAVSIVSPEDGQVFDTSEVYVEWTAYDAKPGLAKYEVYANGNLVFETEDTTVTHVTLNLADGDYNITVVAYDKSGNKGMASVNIVVDLDTPTVSITSPSPGEIVTDLPVVIQWNGVDNHIDHYEVSVDGAPFVDVGTATSYAVYLADGDHYATVRIYDMAGRMAEDTVSFVVDTHPPTLSVTTPYEGQEIYSSIVPVHVIAYDSGSGLDHIELKLYVYDANSNSWVQIDNYTGLDSWHLFVVTQDVIDAHGSNTFKVEATAYDLAGLSTTVEVTFYVYP